MLLLSFRGSGSGVWEEWSYNVKTGEKTTSTQGLELVFILLLVTPFSTFSFYPPMRFFLLFLKIKPRFHLCSGVSGELSLSHLYDFSPSSHSIAFLLPFIALSHLPWAIFGKLTARKHTSAFPMSAFYRSCQYACGIFPDVSSSEKYMRKQLAWKGTLHTHTHWKYPQRILTQTSCFFSCQHPTPAAFISCLQISLLALRFRLPL